jgi:predicted transcriptional regulator
MAADPNIRSENAKEAKLGLSHASQGSIGNLEVKGTKDASVKLSPFMMFQRQFLDELSSPTFGGDIYSVHQYSKTAGAKELERTGAIDILRKKGFLHRVYQALKEHARLLREQDKVHHESAEMGKSIKRLRDAQKTLQDIQKTIGELDKRLENVLTWPFRQRYFDTAVRELEIVEAKLSGLERTQASQIHPALRQKHDRAAATSKYEVSKFKSLLPRFDYELDSLKKKAPQQWLLATLDSELQRRFKRATKQVTSTTRYRIISAVLKSGGLQPISPLTVKDNLAEETQRKTTSARNSPAT